MDDKSTRSTISPGRAAVLFLAAVIVGGCVLAGLYLGLGNPEPPASMEESAAPAGNPVQLFQPLSDEPALPADSGEAAVPPETGKDYGYDYHEILYDEDGLLLAEIRGKRWIGYIAVIDDPSRTYLGTCGGFSEEGAGKRVDVIAEENGAFLAVNGGGFSDPGGVGRGGMPTGVVIIDGNLRMGSRSHVVGVDQEGVLHAGYLSGQDCMDLSMRWAVSYGPTLIVNGEIQEFNNTISEPRTAVAQREDGAIVLLCLQGRQPAALGVTLQQLSEILLEYGAVTAGNMDGGASSYMWFDGEFVNISNSTGNPRPIPTAVLVAPPAGKEDGE